MYGKAGAAGGAPQQAQHGGDSWRAGGWEDGRAAAASDSVSDSVVPAASPRPPAAATGKVSAETAAPSSGHAAGPTTHFGAAQAGQDGQGGAEDEHLSMLQVPCTVCVTCIAVVLWRCGARSTLSNSPRCRCWGHSPKTLRCSSGCGNPVLSGACSVGQALGVLGLSVVAAHVPRRTTDLRISRYCQSLQTSETSTTPTCRHWESRTECFPRMAPTPPPPPRRAAGAACSCSAFLRS